MVKHAHWLILPLGALLLWLLIAPPRRQREQRPGEVPVMPSAPRIDITIRDLMRFLEVRQ